MKKLSALTVVGGLLAIVVASLFAAGASAGPKPSGTPINLMAIGPINAPGFALPSIPVGAQVAIDDINKAGGLNGHPVKLIVCNDKNDPNTATACARQAIKQKVAAVVGGLSVFDLKIVPFLQKAGIPWIGPSTPDAYTQPNMFDIGNEGLPGYVAIGTALAQQGCKKVGIVVSAFGPAIAQQQIAAGVKASHAQVVSSIQAPATGVDWAPIVANARSAGADCIGAGTGPTETPGLIGAINTGRKLKLVLLEGGLPPTLIQQLGAGANGVFAVAGYLPFSSKTGLVQSLRAKAKAKAPKVPLDTFIDNGYAAVEVVAHAAKGLKQVNASTLMKALPKVKGFNTGLGPVLTLTKPGTVARKYPRLFNPNVYLWVVRNGQMVLAQPKPVNIAPGMKLL